MHKVSLLLNSNEIERFVDFAIADGFVTSISSARYIDGPALEKYNFLVDFNTPKKWTWKDHNEFAQRYLAYLKETDYDEYMKLYGSMLEEVESGNSEDISA